MKSLPRKKSNRTSPTRALRLSGPVDALRRTYAKCSSAACRLSARDVPVGAVEALNPERVLILPDGVEDHWNEGYADLISLS